MGSYIWSVLAYTHRLVTTNIMYIPSVEMGRYEEWGTPDDKMAPRSQAGRGPSVLAKTPSTSRLPRDSSLTRITRWDSQSGLSRQKLSSGTSQNKLTRGVSESKLTRGLSNSNIKRDSSRSHIIERG